MTFQAIFFVEDDNGKALSCREAAEVLKAEGIKITHKGVRWHVTKNNIKTLEGIRKIKREIAVKRRMSKPKKCLKDDKGMNITSADAIRVLKAEGYTAYEQKVSYYRLKHGADSLAALRELFGAKTGSDKDCGVIIGDGIQSGGKLYEVAEVFDNGVCRPDLMCYRVMSNGQVLKRTVHYIEGRRQWRKAEMPVENR